MNLVEINMEALIETISHVDDNLGKSFLDTTTGEVIYIPTEVSVALENGTLKEDTFDKWLKEFVITAILISEDEVNRYLSTPLIDEDFYISAMKKYVNSIISNSDLKLELKRALISEEPIKSFKHILMDKPNATDGWYEYEDKCIEEFVRTWLMSIGIELKYLN
ncbi:UPF0158 family protein [Clostridium sp. CF011]|uniref:UPF0158 family protein n=1 Tax=Clostridium sp. CF011 TaxID=2843318 RepID=UPI001C0DBB44|nr:UPF0158 family protein [Clostridium sp. CF011]MBU3090974.1 UPF0158 family protein [Clostridium sp. CF011]WAG69738.1 UPF0158 family protein [Clostridium sp. CF011]